MVNDAPLGDELRRARGQRSFDDVSGQAKISAAYLHKLEANRVGAPSPHVLRRLAAALGIDYSTLMQRAGYLPPDWDRPAAEAAPAVDTGGAQASPTNAEILSLLEDVRATLQRIEAQQRSLAESLESPGQERR